MTSRFSVLRFTFWRVSEAQRKPFGLRDMGALHVAKLPRTSIFVAKLPLTSMLVQKVPRLPRKSSLMCRQASADIYGGAESDTPATQIEPDVLKVSRLPRKMQRRQFDPVRRQAPADIYGGAEITGRCLSHLPCLPGIFCSRAFIPGLDLMILPIIWQKHGDK